jgi:hypothetical protein
MQKWEVLFTATKITVGLELDFFDNTKREPPPKLAVFDPLSFEVTLRRTRFDGMVIDVSANGDEAIIEAQGVRWRITRPNEGEVIHPIKTNMRLHVWMVREQIQ